MPLTETNDPPLEITKKRGRRHKATINQMFTDDVAKVSDTDLEIKKDAPSSCQIPNPSSSLDNFLGIYTPPPSVSAVVPQVANIVNPEQMSLCDTPVFVDGELQCANDGDKPATKKRGRKPKGGKMVQPQSNVSQVKSTLMRTNVILHLKCFLKDLTDTSAYSANGLDGYSFQSYAIVNNDHPPFLNAFEMDLSNEETHKCHTINVPNDGCACSVSFGHKNELEIKELWKKMKSLEHSLHINHTGDKKCACFWDTCEFDNPPVYIPKYILNDKYVVYGHFCSPECAVAYLMNENIDTSVKFERYQLLNNLYAKIYNYKKNIKPAPTPFYMLSKFYGNLTIQEFRALLNRDRLYILVDKPLTKIMPELYEDNDDFIMNNKFNLNSSSKSAGGTANTKHTKTFHEHFSLMASE